MAILLGEQSADARAAVLESEDTLFIWAGTIAEELIVAARRNVADEMGRRSTGSASRLSA